MPANSKIDFVAPPFLKRLIRQKLSRVSDPAARKATRSESTGISTRTCAAHLFHCCLASAATRDNLSVNSAGFSEQHVGGTGMVGVLCFILRRLGALVDERLHAIVDSVRLLLRAHTRDLMQETLRKRWRKRDIPLRSPPQGF